jgi:hypothetical protein
MSDRQGNLCLFLKKNTALLHSATYELLYEERAKNERKSLSVG